MGGQKAASARPLRVAHAHPPSHAPVMLRGMPDVILSGLSRRVLTCTGRRPEYVEERVGVHILCCGRGSGGE